MPDLFGTDIAGIVNDAIDAAGGVSSGTLTKYTPGTRTGGSLTAGTNPTSTSYTFSGFLETKTDMRVGDTLIRAGGEFLTILGASISTAGVEPEAGDRVAIEGVTFEIVGVEDRDPAGATHMCRVKR